MGDSVIVAENLGKLYKLGEVGTGTVSHDLNRWWAKVRGKEDPFSKVGTTNDRTKKADKHEYSWALKDLNFEVGQGEVLGVIGKNGAGKSTLLKLISRITSPTNGSVKIKGRVASLLEVGTGFHPEMTGRENIYMNGTILGMTRKEIDVKLDAIVDFAGVAKYLDTPVKRYSSGMKVRLGFAVAAFLEPEILIVDEVLAVGDVEFQKKALGKMQDVSHNQGRTVLFVSHNMASIKYLCHTGIVLHNGMMVHNKTEINDAINNYLGTAFSSSVDEEISATDLTKEKRNGSLGAEAYFSKLEITSLLTDNKIRFGDKAVIKIEIYNNRSTEWKGISVGLRIDNESGNPIAHDLTTDQIDDLKLVSGKNTIEVSYENLFLKPGTYYLSPTLRSGIQGIDMVDQALKFMISEIPIDGVRPHQKVWGYFQLRPKWNVIDGIL